MKRHRLSATWLGAILGTLSALFIFALSAHAADHPRGSLTEELHQTYALAPDGRIELENINGPVHISTWDRGDVKLDAVKYADTKERLDEAKIEINVTRDLISIRTRYPNHDQTFNWGSHNNPASVEYTLKVPRSVRLDEIKLINGSLDVTGVQGEVNASCINGYLEANDLGGPAHLSTINGRLNAHFGALSSKGLELNSVNGSLELTIPSDAKARIEASTVSGGIDNDFGLRSNRHQWVGHQLSGELGSGGPHIKLSNVNGHIEIHHAQDGRALSPVHDLSGDDDSI